MSLAWFRFYAEFAGDPVVQSLAFEDQRHFVMVLCLKCSGALDRDLPPKRRNAIILRGLGLDISSGEEAQRRLMEVGLIDKNWQPTGWNKRQYVSDVSTPRVRKYRESKEPRNVSETLRNGFGNAPEAEAEADTEKTEALAPTVHSHLAAPKRPPVPVKEILDMYHKLLPMCPSVQKLTEARRRQIEARWRSGDIPDLDSWHEYFAFVAKSKFLTGLAPSSNGRKPFVADIDFLTRESSAVKIYEGKYA